MNPRDPAPSHHGLAVPVDRIRAEALRARLHEELIVRAAHTERSPTADRQELTVHTHPPEPRAHRIITIAAIAVAAAGLAGVALIAARDGASDGDQQPAADAPHPTNAPAPTFPPLPDDQIAAAALPINVDGRLPEYGEGWASVSEGRSVEMRGDIAAAVPACAPFLAAFEAEDRPAFLDAEVAAHAEPPALSATYVVVFPDESAADAMFNATDDPRFIRECSPAYDQELFEETGLTLSQADFSYFPYYNDRPIPGVTEGETYADVDPPDFGADEQWSLQLNYPGDTFQVTTVRIGRVVAVVQGSLTARTLTVDESGRAVSTPGVIQTEEDYHAVIRGVVERTRDALAGITPVQAG